MAGSPEKKQPVRRLTRQRLRRRPHCKAVPHSLIKSVSKPNKATRRSACFVPDMTLADVKRDDLIALLNRADGVRQQVFAQLLDDVARRTTCERNRNARTVKRVQSS